MDRLDLPTGGLSKLFRSNISYQIENKCEITDFPLSRKYTQTHMVYPLYIKKMMDPKCELRKTYLAE